MSGEIEFARRLRREQTDAERKLWSRLRNRGAGVKFRRQVPVGGYFADFLCEEAMLIVEVDGSQHADERYEYDRKRTSVLEAEGFAVMRFWNSEVLSDVDGALASIGRMIDHLGRRHAPHPKSKISTSPEGEVGPTSRGLS